MENNGHSAKVRFLLGYITWLQVHANLEDLLNACAVIIKTNFEQGEMLHQDYQTLGS